MAGLCPGLQPAYATPRLAPADLEVGDTIPPWREKPALLIRDERFPLPVSESHGYP